MTTVSTPSPANLDIELFRSDVKMQIRTLHAKLIFLQETGRITDEIGQMMTKLTTPYTKADSLLTTPLPAPVSSVVLPKILLKAETMQAQSDYAGPDWNHLLIMPGDTIIVYAYINEIIAVGFNTRTNLGGRFPIDISKKVESAPQLEPEVLLSRCSSMGGSSIELLAYKSGQYVRVCRRETDIRWAYALIIVLWTWVGFVPSVILRRLSGIEKARGSEIGFKSPEELGNERTERA